MSLPWSGAQVEWLQAMGFDVLARADAGPVRAAPSAAERPAEAMTGPAVPAALARAARGVDLGPLLAVAGPPRDVASRRALWRLLRPLRKAARAR